MKKFNLLILTLVLIVIQSCQSDSSIIEEEINFESITQETFFINGTQYTVDIGNTNGKSKILNPEIAQMIDEFRAAPEGTIYINAKQEVHLYSEPEDYERFIKGIDATIVAQNAIDITPIDDGCCSSGACPCSGGGDGPGDPIGDGGTGGGGSGGTGGGGSQDFSPDRLCDGNGPCVSIFNNRRFNEPEPDAGEIDLISLTTTSSQILLSPDLENNVDPISGNHFDDRISSVYVRFAKVEFFRRANFNGDRLVLDARIVIGGNSNGIIVFDDLGDLALRNQNITGDDFIDGDFTTDSFFTRSWDNRISSLQLNN